MKMKIALTGLTISLAMASQSAFAQTAQKQSKPVIYVQAATHVTTPKIVKAMPVKIQAIDAKKTARVVRIVREPLPGQTKAIRTVSKGRVIHTAKLSQYDMIVYRPPTLRSSTPNLYRD